MKTRAPDTGGPPAPPPRVVLPVADSGRIVGRQSERARLQDAWQDVQGGGTRLVLVAGEPGVGKTRLAAELAEPIVADDAPVLVGRCERDVAVPYAPFLEALEPVLSSRSDAWLHATTERHGPELARLFPAIARRLGDVVPEQPSASRSCLLRAVAATLADAGGGKPLLLVLEDLHWATCSTVLLLTHLAEHRFPAGLLIVATYRDAAIHPGHPLSHLLDRVASARQAERVVLANLSPQAVTALLVDHAGVAGQGASALAADLWRTTEGAPFLLTEVIRDLVAAGVVSDGAVRADAMAKTRIPHDVAELVARRMERPRSPGRAVIEAASVVGRSFSVADLAAISGAKEDEVRSALAKGVSARLVIETGEPATYRFVHDLVRDAVYWSLPANRRVRLHRQLVELITHPERTAGLPPAVLVHHCSAATPVGRSRQAVSHARAAGDAAMEVLAFEEAAAFYGHGLAFLGGGGSASERADLLLALGSSNHRAGESARARQSYLQAAAVAAAGGDGPRLGRAVLGLGDVMGIWGGDGLLTALLEQALKANPDDPAMRARLMARLAQARAALEGPDQRKARSDQAWELAWDSRDPETMGAVLRARHEALSAPDDLEDRVEIDGELVAMATAAKDDELALLAHSWRMVDLLEEGHLVDADRDRMSHAAIARRLGDKRHLRDAAAWSAMRAMLAGRPGRATAHIDRALTLGQQVHDPDASSIYWVQQLGLALDWGDVAELDELVTVWRELVRSHDRDPAWRASLALLLARTGRAAEAAEEVEDLLADDGADLPLDARWLPTLATIGEVLALLGDGARAPAVAKLLSPYSRRLLVVGPGLVCRGSVARVLGLLARTAEHWDDAERHFQAALATHERLASPPLLARTRVEFGTMLSRRPGGPLHHGRTRATLEQAIEEAERAGLPALAREARAVLEGAPSGGGHGAQDGHPGGAASGAHGGDHAGQTAGGGNGQ